MDVQPDITYLERMRSFFESGTTRTYDFRRQQLQNFKEALHKYEHEIYDALYVDLKKTKEECWVTEIGFIISEINYGLKHLQKWMKPQRVATNLLNFPGSSYILHEPLGVVLIVGPWNYPLQLLLTPLVGAIAAGNCAVIKPSEFAPATAAIIQKIAKENFPFEYIKVVQGHGADVISSIMENFRFDHVFYCGSTHVGTIIYEMAAKKLVPVTLEMGGKCPCIIEKDANLRIAARRIAVTKFSNAGQMCVAPDHIIVHQDVKEIFVHEIKKAIHDFYNSEEQRNYYGKIVNEKHFRRLVLYMEEGNIIYGGSHNEEQLFIEPTLIENISPDASVMKEEIFGPILPILTFTRDVEVYAIINRNKSPLALYVFTSSSNKAQKWIQNIPFGGGCINNASWHLTNHHLPFGGRGNSGIGNYHGKFSFETFSHKKGILKTPTWFDPSVKYPPFAGKLKLFKKLIR